MSNKTTFKRLQLIFADQSGELEENITPETTMLQLGLDSLDTVEVIMYIEDEFQISLDEETEDKAEDQLNKETTTVSDIVKFMEELLENKSCS